MTGPASIAVRVRPLAIGPADSDTCRRLGEGQGEGRGLPSLRSQPEVFLTPEAVLASARTHPLPPL